MSAGEIVSYPIINDGPTGEYAIGINIGQFHILEKSGGWADRIIIEELVIEHVYSEVINIDKLLEINH